ncbi:MAG: ligase LigA [Bacteroidota bacterium]|jgi:DNA ligase (NAD+)
MMHKDSHLIIEQTHQFIKHPANADTINALKDVLRFHEHRYYVLDEPLISDFEYDTLFDQLKEIEKNHPELITPDSPTQRVAVGLSDDFTEVKHIVPMLSLENSYDENDLKDWDRKVKEFIEADEVEYVVEPKFDGGGISIIFENNIFTRGATRGDGSVGEEITNNLKQLRSIPLSADFSKNKIRKIEIRGEVIIPNEKFKKINQQRVENNLPPFANPRNAATGGLRMKDPKEVAQRGMEAFLYHVSFCEDENGNDALRKIITHHSQAIETIDKLGIRSSFSVLSVCKNIDEVIAKCNEWEAKRNSLDYEIDGMVVKVNSLILQEKCGYTAHHPRWAIAYKFAAKQATSTLLNIEYQVGRTGAITPVAKIEPVPLAGVTISSISLFNEDVIREKDLMIGDKVLIERSGDVIPYIVKSLADARNGSEQKNIFPTNCPSCNSILTKPEEEAVWRCVNVNCPAQSVERIIHFVSKDAMDVKGLGEANIRKFYEMGIITDIPSIFKIDFEKISSLDGFGEKSIQILKDGIEECKKLPLHRLIFALGIRYVGEGTAKSLERSIHQFDDIKNIVELKKEIKVEDVEKKLMKFQDIGKKSAQSLIEYFSNENNLKMLEELKNLGLNFEAKVAENSLSKKFSELTFLFTGTLPTLGRSKAEAIVEEHGGTVLGSINKKLNYLIVGADAGSKLEKAQKIASIKIIDEAEFLKMVNE